MPDVPADIKEREAIQYGLFGEDAAKQLMTQVLEALTEQNAHPVAPIIAGLGVIKTVGVFLRLISVPSDGDVVEQSALAYLRGALRGMNGPVHDDGKPFTGTLNG